MNSTRDEQAKGIEDMSKNEGWADVDLLKAAIDILGEGVIVVDREGKFLVFNRLAERMLGMETVETPPSEWTEALGCFFPDGTTSVPPQERPLARSLRGEEVADFEMLFKNPGVPSGVLVRASSRPLRDEKGVLLGAVAWLRDITDLKKTEKQLDRLSNAVEQTADSVFITDKAGILEYVNPAFIRTTGYSAEEALGRSPGLLKSGQHSKEFYRKLWTTVSSGEVFRGTIINRKKTGQLIWTEQTITPMKTDCGETTHYVSVLKDVTELRRQQEQEFQLRLAREVQQRYYRETSSYLAGFDIAAAAFPACETGGDYFDFLRMPDGCLGIAIGDVSGHGFGSALIMAETRAYIRSFAEAELDVGKILTRVNQALAADLEGGRHVTLLLGRLDPERRTFVYASAGHIPCYLMKCSGQLGLVMESTGVPLGLFAASSFESSELIFLEQGDLLAFLTDGVTEATSPEGQEFGSDRVLDILKNNCGLRAGEIVEKINEAARSFAGEQLPHDDITTLVCKVTQ
ncbi:MAG: SpoIIE family protein phosphatase [Acidobacteriota bacterium]